MDMDMIMGSMDPRYTIHKKYLVKDKKRVLEVILCFTVLECYLQVPSLELLIVLAFNP